MSRMPLASLFIIAISFGSQTIAAASTVTGPGPIVSGSLASDEILVELFKDQNPEQIVLSPMADNPAFSNIIEAAKKIPRRWHNSAESLVALKPQLVILASYNNPTLKARLNQAKIPFIELAKFERLRDIRENIALIGKAVRQEKTSEQLLNHFDAALISFQKKIAINTPRPTMISYSTSQTPGGTGTLIDDMITVAGGINLAATVGLSGWSKLNAEVLAAMQPDYIIVASVEKSNARIIQQIAQDPLWKHMRAVREKKYIFIPQAALLAVSHHTLEAIETLQNHLTGPSHVK